MAFAHIQTDFDAVESGTTTPALAYTSSVTAGSLLVCAFGWNSSTATCTVADNVNGAWTAVGSQQVGTGGLANLSMQMFYFIGAAAGATTVTGTLSTSLTNTIIAVHEYSGPSFAIDGTPAYNTGSGSTHTTPTVTTTVTDALVVAYAINEFAFTGVDSPFTLREVSFASADYVASGAAGGKSATFTGGATQADIGGTIAFKEGAPPPPAPKLRTVQSVMRW